jgi:hypothetical protein
VHLRFPADTHLFVRSRSWATSLLVEFRDCVPGDIIILARSLRQEKCASRTIFESAHLVEQARFESDTFDRNAVAHYLHLINEGQDFGEDL